MRLLNVNTLEFKWFVTGSKEQGPPPYIILSHTWVEDEVSFEEHEAWLKARRTDPSTPEPDKAGFRKIKEFCRVCREDYHIILEHTFWISRARTYAHKINDPGSELKSIHGSEDMATLSEAVEWAWVDACCIDKRSSAELSEAINSMYRWYREAAICVAYLVDTLQLAGDETAENVALSRWWKRGWTLQELIAPVDVHFYNTDWVHFWSRKGHAREITVISSVDEHLLRDSMEIPSKNYPIGTILSWAANRETTRIEDRSYSLLGLLDVSMPLLYGEGDKAFARLRDEVLKDSEDPSILVWRPRYADFDLDAGLAPASLDSFMFWRWRDLQVTRRASGEPTAVLHCYDTMLNYRSRYRPQDGANGLWAACACDPDQD